MAVPAQPVVEITEQTSSGPDSVVASPATLRGNGATLVDEAPCASGAAADVRPLANGQGLRPRRWQRSRGQRGCQHPAQVHLVVTWHEDDDDRASLGGPSYVRAPGSLLQPGVSRLARWPRRRP